MIILLLIIELEQVKTNNLDSILIYYNEKGYPFVQIVIDSFSDQKYFVRIIKGEKVVIKKIGLSSISPAFWKLLPYYFSTEDSFLYSFTKFNEIKRKFEKKIELKTIKPVRENELYIIYGETKNNEEMKMTAGVTYYNNFSGELSFSLINILNRYENFTILMSRKSKKENFIQMKAFFPFIFNNTFLKKLYTEEKITIEQNQEERKLNIYGLIGYYFNYYIKGGTGIEVELENFKEYFMFTHYLKDDGYPFSFFKNEIFFKAGTDYKNFYRFNLSTNINRTFKKITLNLMLYSHLLDGEKPITYFGGVEKFPGFSKNSIVEKKLLFSGIKIGYNTGYTYLCLFSGYAKGKGSYTTIMSGINVWVKRNTIKIYSGYNNSIKDVVVQIKWEVNI